MVDPGTHLSHLSPSTPMYEDARATVLYFVTDVEKDPPTELEHLEQVDPLKQASP
jgi:hypothetical protein